MQYEGRYFDGEAGLRLTVTVLIEADHLRLYHPDLPRDAQSWKLQDVRGLRDEARTDQLTLSLRAAASDDSALIDMARLSLTDADAIDRIRKLCPNLMKRDLPRGTVWKVTSRLGMAAGALAAMVFLIIPAMANTLAAFIPIEREVRWGKAVVAQMEWLLGGSEVGSLACSTPEGDAAIAQMLARLGENTPLQYDINVSVFDHEMINAFAAPGGQVVFMRGLIDEAGSADEVAAVLAHEIGHVESRDATRNTLRAAGSAGLLAMVVGDFLGGSLAVVLAEATLSASYTREAEREADVFALNLLNQAKVSSEGLGDFFHKISELESGFELPEYLSTHPPSEERAEAAHAFASGQGDTSPILTEVEWQAMRTMCDD